MNAASIVQSRVLGIVAVGLAALLAAVGVLQAGEQVGAVETEVVAPLIVALGFAAIVVAAGRGAAGGRRTPYW